MNLLIITQKVDKNDPILGFFHGWLFHFSQRAGKVCVIANEVGDYDLPKNVKVCSLGKEKGYRKIHRILRFFWFFVSSARKYPDVFVHMCPEYAILAWFFSIDRKILMWYVHRSKNLKLWLAEKMVNKIFTVSKNSCQVKSKKIEIVGHGIDTNKFRMQNAECRPTGDLPKGGRIKNYFGILSVGRISPIKDYKTLVRAICYLVHKKGIKDIKMTIIGDAYLKSDKEYKKEVVGLIKKKRLGDYVKLIGTVSQNQLPEIYNTHGLLVNQCPTGGMDKVVLEASACELSVLVANKSFEELIGGYDLIFGHGRAEDLAEKILKIKEIKENDLRKIGRYLRQQVVGRHSLDKLAERTISFLKDN